VVRQRPCRAHMTAKLERWLVVLRARGATRRAEFAAWPGPEADFPGSECIVETYTIVDAGTVPEEGYVGGVEPSGVWKTFKAHVDRRPIRTLYGTRAVDLVQDPDTLEVFGVIAEQDGE